MRLANKRFHLLSANGHFLPNIKHLRAINCAYFPVDNNKSIFLASRTVGMVIRVSDS